MTSLTQGGESIHTDQTIESVENVTFYWPNNFFEFEFAALSYAQPEKNQYAYKLEGFDGQWNESGARNFGRYTNLPSGSYTLRILGSNNSGVWNEQGVSVRIVVAPPFWGTWWFQGAAVLLLVGVVIGAYRWRVRSIEARSRELEAEVQQRTAELRQEIAQRAQAEEALRQSEMDKAVTAERNRLARELHDAVTQTLFSASLIAEVLPRMWQADPEKGRQQLEDVRLLTRGALAEMRALLIELRPGALAQANMRDLLGQLGRAMTGRTGVPVRVAAQGDGSLPPAVQLAFYRIAQEALNNVAKHADATQVEVEFQCEAGRVRLAIGDDGRGFVPGQGDFDLAGVPPGHFGLGIMRERAAAIDADLRLDSQVGAGTRVVVEWRGEERGLAD
jgi:signal transduction histidine kinase